MPSLSSNNYPVGIGYDTNGDPAGLLELSSVSATEMAAETFLAKAYRVGVQYMIPAAAPSSFDTAEDAQIILTLTNDYAVTGILPPLELDTNMGRLVTFQNFGTQPLCVSSTDYPFRKFLNNQFDTMTFLAQQSSEVEGSWSIIASGNYSV